MSNHEPIGGNGFQVQQYLRITDIFVPCGTRNYSTSRRCDVCNEVTALTAMLFNCCQEHSFVNYSYMFLRYTLLTFDLKDN